MWVEAHAPEAWGHERQAIGATKFAPVLVGQLAGGARPARKGPQPPTLPKMSRPPAAPLCAGQAELFDDCSPDGAERARKVCRGCPARMWCDSERRHAQAAGLPITGTWAGVTYAAGSGGGRTAGHDR